MRSFLIVALLASGCDGPQAEAPVPVRAADLARFYRDNPSTASEAYDGRPVLLLLTNPVRHGSELRWRLTSSPTDPAVVVCRFGGEELVPPPAPVVWLVGTCRGRVTDGKAREFSGYDFHVLVTDCRVSGPPRTTPP